MIQSTLGMSSPRAATFVQTKMLDSALRNSKKVFVRLSCFCFPYVQVSTCANVQNEAARTCNAMTGMPI